MLISPQFRIKDTQIAPPLSFYLLESLPNFYVKERNFEFLYIEVQQPTQIQKKLVLILWKKYLKDHYLH